MNYLVNFQPVESGFFGQFSTGVNSHVIVDECHHVSAPRFEMVLNEVRAKYVLGLTATPERQDGHQKIIFMAAGPIRHKVKSAGEDRDCLEIA